MFPVRRELVGKRFAFIEGDGRTGRQRGSLTGLTRNWDNLSWVTGIILAANVDELKTRDESIAAKKVKVFVQYDSHYQLPKEWIKLYSGGHRIFLLEENLVLCRRKDTAGHLEQSYCWPALRLVPILDKDFMDENPHLIPVEFMGAKKQLSFVVFEDITQVFPSEDQTMLLQSVQKDRYLKSDYQSWERIQKTQMILLFGPYSLTGCRVEVNDTSNGRCYRAVIISHDYMKRVLDVMDDQLLKSQRINPKLVQINFLASDEEIDKLMYGEAPKAMPTRYSRYGHQVHPSRYHLEDTEKGLPSSSSHQLSQFTLPKWMTNVTFSQDQFKKNQSLNSDYNQEGVLSNSQLSAVKHGDKRQIESPPIGSLIEMQIGMQKQDHFINQSAEGQSIPGTEGLGKGYRSAFSPQSVDTTQQISNHMKAKFGPHLHQSFSSNDAHHSCPTSSSGDPCLERSVPKGPGTAPCVISGMMGCYPPSLTSSNGQLNETYHSPSGASNSQENNVFKFDQLAQPGRFQSSPFTRDRCLEERFATGSSDPKMLSNAEILPDFRSDLLSQSDSSISTNAKQQQQADQQHAQVGKSMDKLLNRKIEKGANVPFDRSMQASSMNCITDNDFTNFLDQIDVCFNPPSKVSTQQTHGISKSSMNFNLQSDKNDNFQTMPSTSKDNPKYHRDDAFANIQQKITNNYSQYETHDPRTIQKIYKHNLNKHFLSKQPMASIEQTRKCPSNRTSHIQRSLSSDNFQISSHTLGMSPPTAPVKKNRAKGKNDSVKLRSKDDTSKPSSEATEKVSLLLSNKCAHEMESNESIKVTAVSKYKEEMNLMIRENGAKNESAISKGSLSSESEVEEFEVDAKRVRSTNTKDDENRESLVMKSDKPRKDEYVTARVALAVAGFNRNIKIDNKNARKRTVAEQKMPTGASWLEILNQEVSHMGTVKSKSKVEEGRIKRGVGCNDYECIDNPPSPEFLPRKDKDAAAPLEDGIQDQFVKDVLSTARTEEMSNIQSNAFEEESNEEPKDDRNAEERIKDDKKEVALLKVPIASVPAASLGINLNIFDKCKKQDITETSVRNIYGRAIYQTSQRGPNFAHQVRTDKIVRIASTGEKKSEANPSDGKSEFFIKEQIEENQPTEPTQSNDSTVQSNFKELTQPTSQLIISNVTQQHLSVQMSANESKQTSMKDEFIEGKLASPERKARKSICRHKRKPCKCDLEKAMANLTDSTPHTNAFNSTIEVLKHLSNKTHWSPKSQLNGQRSLNTLNTTSESETGVSGQKQEQLNEPSFNILERKEFTGECNYDQKKQFPTDGETGYQKLKADNDSVFSETSNVQSESLSEEEAANDATKQLLQNQLASIGSCARSLSAECDASVLNSSPLISNLSPPNFSKTAPRSSTKCKHKRRPCRCDIEAATKLSEYMEHLKGVGDAQAGNVNTGEDISRYDSSSVVAKRSSLLSFEGVSSTISKENAEKQEEANNESSSKIEFRNRSLKMDMTELPVQAVDDHEKRDDAMKMQKRAEHLEEYVSVIAKESMKTDKSQKSNSRMISKADAFLQEGNQIIFPTANRNQKGNFLEKSGNIKQITRKCKHKRKPCKCDMQDGSVKIIEDCKVSDENVILPSDETERKLIDCLFEKDAVTNKSKGNLEKAVEVGKGIESDGNMTHENENMDNGLNKVSKNGVKKLSTTTPEKTMEEQMRVMENEKEANSAKAKMKENTCVEKEGQKAFSKINKENAIEANGIKETSLKESETNFTKSLSSSTLTEEYVNRSLRDAAPFHSISEREDLKSLENVDLEKGDNKQRASVVADGVELKEVKMQLVKSEKHGGKKNKNDEIEANTKLMRNGVAFVTDESTEKKGFSLKDKSSSANDASILDRNKAELSMIESGKTIVSNLLKGIVKPIERATIKNTDDTDEMKSEPKVLQEQGKSAEKTISKTAVISSEEFNCGLDSVPSNFDADKNKGHAGTASNSITITVPANLSLPSNVFNAPGSRVTARAKLVCAEKSLMPLKGSPVSVSFDGGKTFTLASIVEIRSRSNDETPGNDDKGIQIESGKNVNDNLPKVAAGSIDAELLDVCASEISNKDLKRNERKKFERSAQSKRKKKITKTEWESDDSYDDPDFTAERKNNELEANRETSTEQHKDLRRSSRFTMKKYTYEEEAKGESEEEKDEINESFHPEDIIDTLFPSSESENNGDLSEDDPNYVPKGSSIGELKKCERKKRSIISMSPIEKETNESRNDDEKETKRIQTSKDEMFDCCAIHQDLFCPKCLPFKRKEGFWPASSRSKEVNGAWRMYLRKCAKHDNSKCVECWNVEENESTERSGDLVKQKNDFNEEIINKNALMESDDVIMEETMENVVLDLKSAVPGRSDVPVLFLGEDGQDAKQENNKRELKRDEEVTEKYEKVTEPQLRNKEGERTEKKQQSKSEQENKSRFEMSKEDVKNEVIEEDGVDKIIGSQAMNDNRKSITDERESLVEVEKDTHSKDISSKTLSYKVVGDEESQVKEVFSNNATNTGIGIEDPSRDAASDENVVTVSVGLRHIKGTDITDNMEDIKNTASEKFIRKRKHSNIKEDKADDVESMVKRSNIDEKEGDSDNKDTMDECPLFIAPDEKCPIHGRFKCCACRPFYEKEGEWPCWARRGEVQFVWESKDSTRTKGNTVKCRIHLKVNCQKCLPFKDENGLWPSWLERDKVEEHHRKIHLSIIEDEKSYVGSKFSKGSLDKRHMLYGSLKRRKFFKTNSCFLHDEYFCLQCYVVKDESGNWPENIQMIEKHKKLREKRRENLLASWGKCCIHHQQICLPCFNFWKREGRAPYHVDKPLVDNAWEILYVDVKDKKCNIHNEVMCKLCIPVVIMEKKFPTIKHQLKSIYSWKYFENLLSPSPSEEGFGVQRKAKIDKKVPVIKNVSSSYNKLKTTLKIPKKFHCNLHKIFPCFVCMQKFVKVGCWPDEKGYNFLWEKWIMKWSDDIHCNEHNNMFCRKCNETNLLFKKCNNSGVTDVFLNQVKEKRGRKSNQETDSKKENRTASVSSKGRVRSKVLRPGTVDISQLAEDFVVKESKVSDSDDENINWKKMKTLTKMKQDLIEGKRSYEKMDPVKRKRGRPPKRLTEYEEPVPKKRKEKKKFGLVEQIRSGSLKIINVDDLRDQLQNDHQRDPSPTQKEYIQLLENAEKMNVKYFAISANRENVVKEKNIEGMKSEIIDLEGNKNGDKEKDTNETGDAIKKDASEVHESNKVKGISPIQKDSNTGKFGSLTTWSERDIELILAKVEKAAEAAKAKKAAALHRRKQKQGKRPLTVAQVLAIKRNKEGDSRPVMDDNAKEDLEKLLIEAERRSIDLDTLLDEAIKTKDKEEHRKQMAKKKAKDKMETFLQEKPCDQTPKLPKCRDCRIVDKRDADQHAFCRFVMFRRLFKRQKTGKIESAGFCSPASADQNAFMPWISKSSDVEMKASVCHYIIKNIAGQFCTVVEEECQALMLGTKDGAVAWKRAVAGVREMCDACATTVFNIHWVCEKCGFGVCLDCFKSKLFEQEMRGEGSKSFEFNWFSCAPGLTHKPCNLTVAQIIPKDALWDLCQSLVNLCMSLNIPFKLSENMLKTSIATEYSTNREQNIKELKDTLGSNMESSTAVLKDRRPAGQEEDIEKLSHLVKDRTSKVQNLEGSEYGSEDIAENIPGNSKSSSNVTVLVENVRKESNCLQFATSSLPGNDMDPLIFAGSNESNCTTNGNMTVENEITEPELKLESSVEKKKSGNYLNEALDAKIKNEKVPRSVEMLGNPSRISTDVMSANSSSWVVDQSSSKKGIDDSKMYYDLVCKRAFKVLDEIRKWKKASESMEDIDVIFDDAERTTEQSINNENRNEIMKTSIRSKVASKSLCRDGNDIEYSNRGFCQEFQNNLDILAMVASGLCNELNTEDKEVMNKQSNWPNQADVFMQNHNELDEKQHKTFSSSYIHNSRVLMAENLYVSSDDLPVASYLCDGKLLQLNYSRHPKNVELFRNVWRKGFPLIVSRVDDLLNKNLWKPETFAAEFGAELADVVNCRTGEILHQFSVGEFWKGFQSVRDRPVDSNGLSMLLKLKDWPPGADFLDKMPKRFDDLMNAIPLPDYTRRNGQWNLVSRLPPDHFVKPDLGPKMYNAYGSAAVPSAGTTNLHLDMSDAVNVMVYVGVPRDPLLGDQEIEDALKAVDLACCEETKKRIRKPGVIPGALWHIYTAEDADKIRKLLRKVAEERKLKFSIYNDPIHDQSFYLDYNLRKRLKAEYDVTGFAICQCLGDAVFIPAGAPHQVLNLHSCVKVAEDFVSPERIGQCFNLTQEFRFLSDRHTNHEDKLQIKNIIYHSVKDSVAVLKEEVGDVTTEEGENGLIRYNDR